jgi:hypothetical protein
MGRIPPEEERRLRKVSDRLDALLWTMAAAGAFVIAWVVLIRLINGLWRPM